MAIKLSSKNQDNIPTLTEIVTEEKKQTGQAGSPIKNSAIGSPLPPKFERVLEKIIYKKLHQQLITTSQVLAADIMAELEKHLQTADKTQNTPDKNPD